MIGDDGIVDSLGLPVRARRRHACRRRRPRQPPTDSSRPPLLEASLETSFEYYEQNYRRHSSRCPRATNSASTSRWRWGIDISLPWVPISLSPQLRYEQLWNDFNLDGVIPPLPPGTDSSTTDHSVDPRLGARWDLPWGLTLKGNIGTFFRPPSFQELFGIDGLLRQQSGARP